MVALPAVVSALKMVTPPVRLTITALPAVAVSVPDATPKWVSPRFSLVMAMLLAEVALKKVVIAGPNEPSLLIEVMPVVLALTMSKLPKLVTAPMMLPVWVASPSCNVEQSQIVVPPV